MEMAVQKNPEASLNPSRTWQQCPSKSQSRPSARPKATLNLKIKSPEHRKVALSEEVLSSAIATKESHHSSLKQQNQQNQWFRTAKAVPSDAPSSGLIHHHEIQAHHLILREAILRHPTVSEMSPYVKFEIPPRVRDVVVPQGCDHRIGEMTLVPAARLVLSLAPGVREDAFPYTVDSTTCLTTSVLRVATAQSTMTQHSTFPPHIPDPVMDTNNTSEQSSHLQLDERYSSRHQVPDMSSNVKDQQPVSYTEFHSASPIPEETAPLEIETIGPRLLDAEPFAATNNSQHSVSPPVISLPPTIITTHAPRTSAKDATKYLRGATPVPLRLKFNIPSVEAAPDSDNESVDWQDKSYSDHSLRDTSPLVEKYNYTAEMISEKLASPHDTLPVEKEEKVEQSVMKCDNVLFCVECEPVDRRRVNFLLNNNSAPCVVRVNTITSVSRIESRVQNQVTVEDVDSESDSEFSVPVALAMTTHSQPHHSRDHFSDSVLMSENARLRADLASLTAQFATLSASFSHMTTLTKIPEPTPVSLQTASEPQTSSLNSCSSNTTTSLSPSSPSSMHHPVKADHKPPVSKPVNT
eukprot:gene30332-37526_t